jgi:hypothetical protein
LSPTGGGGGGGVLVLHHQSRLEEDKEADSKTVTLHLGSYRSAIEMTQPVLI